MNLLKMGEEKLNESLRKFYAAARAITDEEFNQWSLVGFLNSDEWLLMQTCMISPKGFLIAFKFLN